MRPATTVTAMRRMPPEDCLWAKSWKGRTILSTGGRPLSHYAHGALCTRGSLRKNRQSLFTEVPRRGVL